MKSKLPTRGDLVEVDTQWTLDHMEVIGQIGVVMEVEERSRGRDYMNDSIYENGCWVMFPNSGDLYARTRWHWLEHHRLKLVSES